MAKRKQPTYRVQIKVTNEITLRYLAHVLSKGYKDAPTNAKAQYSRVLTSLEVAIARGEERESAL